MNSPEQGHHVDDATFARLRAGAATPLPENVFIELRRSVAAAADAWVAASLAAKGWTGIAHAHAEEWASGPLPVARCLAALHERSERGAPAARARAGERSGDGLDVVAVPRLRGAGDSVLLRGYRAELHVDSAAPAATPRHDGKLALVLGAGNVTATPLLDVLDQVFLRGRAVVLKLAPAHTALREPFAAAFAPLVRTGRLHLVAGDATTGRQLAHHAAFAAIHLTGAATTWAALRSDDALRQKELTAEVGCCTPALVVPGRWTAAQLDHVARQLAAFVATNGGGTCLAPRVLLTAAAWPQREVFLARVRSALSRLPARVPFLGTVHADHERARQRPAAAGALQPELVSDRAAAAVIATELCGRELFAPVLNEFPLAGDDAEAWLQTATDFVRTHCFGALSAYVFAPPAIRRGARATIDTAITRLPHGTIAINTWTGLGYGLGTTPWGVPPGSPIECGSGWTRNLTGATVRRVVVEAPFRPWPPSPWLPGHRSARATLRALVLHTLQPSLLGLCTTALHALRS